MITIIHGDDTVSSLKALDMEKEKREGAEIVHVDGIKTDITELTTVIQSHSFFQDKKTVIVENLIARAASSQKDKIIHFLQNESKSSDIIIWEKTQVDKRFLSKIFPNCREILSQPPMLLFRLLDSLGAESPSKSLSLFRSVLSQRAAELIHLMLLRQVRLLLLAKDKGEKGFPGMPQWQALRFLRQSRYFDKKKLLSAYRQLLSIENNIKSGQTPFRLGELLDIFILSL